MFACRVRTPGGAGGHGGDLGHAGLAWHAREEGVAEDRLENVLGPPEAAEVPDPFAGMLLIGGLGGVGVALVVEVVQQAGQAPALLVLAEVSRVGAHRGLDGEHVLPE